MKSKHAKVIVSLFLLAIFTMSIISFVDKDKAISEKESRTLAQKPKLTVKSLFNGSYVRDFEEYYADQFPFRDWLLNLNFKVNSLLSIKSQDDVSLIGGGQGSDNDDNNIFNPPPTSEDTPIATPIATPTPDETPDITSGTTPGQTM